MKETVMILQSTVDWSSGVNNAWNDIAEFVPRLVAFLLILLVGWLVAKLLAKVTNAVLERVGFDRVVERGGVRDALSRTEYDASDLVAKLVYYTILLIALVYAFNVFGPNPVSELLSGVIAWLPRLVVAILIVIVAAAIAKAVKDIVSAALSSLSYGNLVATIASVFILALGVIAALNQIGIATMVTTPILIAVLATVGGILVVGVGGGLVRPMQRRWERWLDQAETEIPQVRDQVDPDAAREQAQRQATQAAAAADQGTARLGETRTQVTESVPAEDTPRQAPTTGRPDASGRQAPRRPDSRPS
jgi:hypothetical protein